MHIRPHEKLVVWQEAHKLCLLIYHITKKYPQEERYGLVSQMRKSSASVPTNIVEGNMRITAKDKAHFFDISRGSLEELHYQAILSRDLTYIALEQFRDVDDRIQCTSYLLTKLRSAVLFGPSESSDSSDSSVSYPQ